jgi:hypothetical protein
MELCLITSQKPVDLNSSSLLLERQSVEGLKAAKSAAHEAYEEAGVLGTIRAKSVGFFTYDKRQEEDGIIVPCAVRVFPLLVKRQDKTWPEYRQRQSQWFVPEEALSAIKGYLEEYLLMV